MKMLNRILPFLVLAVFEISAGQAQELLDFSKITCEEFVLVKVADPDKITTWLNGYYSGKRNNTVVDVQQLKEHAEKILRYCELNMKVTVMEASEKLFAPGQ